MSKMITVYELYNIKAPKLVANTALVARIGYFCPLFNDFLENKNLVLCELIRSVVTIWVLQIDFTHSLYFH